MHSSSGDRPGILVVEDDRFQQEFYRVTFSDEFEVTVAGTLAEARRLLEECRALAVALVDGSLPDGSGVDFVTEMQELRPELPWVVMSATIGDSGRVRWLTKPVEPEQVLAILAHRTPVTTPAPASLPPALLELWQQQRPGILERIASLEESLQNQPLTQAAAVHARREAHDLGGLLGILGNSRAAMVTRHVEHALQGVTVSADGVGDALRNLARVKALVAEP